MRKTMRTLVAPVLVSAGLVVLSGCAMFEQETLPPAEKVVTCTDMVSHGVSNFNENDVVKVLQSESQAKDLARCWVPLVQSALQEGVVLPQPQLKLAIKQLNSEQYQATFHEAVYRYLAQIARGNGTYRPEDKALLRAYCSYLINHVENRDDGRLGQVQLLTKRLDPDMYNRFFK